jgi:hypothetical protein
METINVAIRQDRETKRPILFFVNENPRGWWIDCYDRIGQHSQASRGYMLACKPLSMLGTDELALLREWRNLGEPCNARPVARLTYPRKNYLGD